MEHTKPVKKFRVGVINATVWNNISKEGKTYPTISLERSYKDKDGWKSASSLRHTDLPAALLVLQEVFRYLSFSDRTEGNTTQGI